jgi:hypothetical protein
MGEPEVAAPLDPTSPTGLQARPPEEGMPCVDHK